METQKKRGDTLIRGGTVVTGQATFRGDVLIAGGVIQEVAENLSDAIASRVVDATGKLVLPGIIDAHNHPVFADLMGTFSVSAAFGGVTTIIPCIGNMPAWGYVGKPVDVVRRFIDESQRDSVLDFGLHTVFRRVDDVEQAVPRLIDLGVLSFKMYMTEPSRGRTMPDDKMLLTMNLAAEGGGLAMVHAENGYAIDFLVQRLTAQGKVSREHFALSQPSALEVEAVRRAATYAAATNCPLYLLHLSAREVPDLLLRLREEGQRIYGETCPQYLTLTNQAVLSNGALAKLSPPLREAVDNAAMWQGLASRALQVVASDSCNVRQADKLPKEPVEVAEGLLKGIPKAENIFKAGFGAPWVEQMLPVVYDAGVNEGRLILPRLVQVMCENPAKIFGLYPRKGALLPGSDADVVVFDPSLHHTLGVDSHHSNSDFTLFEGRAVLGKPVFSMQRGEVVIEDGELKRERDRGRFLPGDPERAAYAPRGYPVE